MNKRFERIQIFTWAFLQIIFMTDFEWAEWKAIDERKYNEKSNKS